MDSPVSSELEVPGDIERWTFSVAEPTRIVVDYLASSSSLGLNWWLVDGHGNTFLSRTTSIGDTGVFALPAGDYTLSVAGETNITATYEFNIRTSQVAAPEPLTLGEVVSGHIDTPRGEDSYTFSLPAGQRLYFDRLTADNRFVLNWRLESATDAIPFDWSTSLDDRGPYVLPAGDYVLRIRSESAATSAYSFVVHTAALEDHTLELDQPTTGAIAIPGEHDVYSFSLATTTRVHFKALTTTEQFGLNWLLRDTGGRTYRSQTTSFAWGGPYDLRPGDYELVILAEGSITTTYEFELATVADSVSAAALGDTLEGTIAAGQVHRYSFTAPPNQLLDIVLVSSSNQNGLNYVLRDAVGRVVRTQTTSLSSTTGIALLGGAYTLEIRPEAATGTGTYALTLTDAGLSTYAPIPGVPLATGASTAGTLAAGSPDIYTLSLADTARVMFDLTLGASGVTWTLTDSAGRTVFANENARYTDQDQGPFTLVAGEYALSIQHASNTPD